MSSAALTAPRQLDLVLDDVLRLLDQRDRLDLSGEFFVAAQLLRRDIPAAVVYGNAKRGEIIARHGNVAISFKSGQ
jgi:hypothetical protein